MNEISNIAKVCIQDTQYELEVSVNAAKAVLFYESNHYYLSNFSSFTVMWRDQLWYTSEVAYQMAKFDSPSIVSQITCAMSSHDAMQIAIKNKHMVRGGWETEKLIVMKDILKHKLEQHEYIQRKLKQTLGKILIEDSWRDDYWGRGSRWKGQNQLGKCWMEVRDNYFTNQSDHYAQV